jgi:hypothetical protein
MILKNILTQEECKFLHEKYLVEKIDNKNADFEDEESRYGFRPSDYFNVYMDKLKPIIISHIDTNTYSIENVNTYIREYKNGAILKKHIDRKDINITLSITLFSNINQEWPLCAEIDGKVKKFEISIGDGVLILNSNEISHWRDELICKNDEYILQLFVHWIFKKAKKTII